MPPPRRQFSLGDAAPRWWMLLALLIALSAYPYLGRGKLGQGGPATLQGRTMGTTYQIVLGRSLEGGERADLHRRIEVRLAEINGRMSHYDPGSELSRFNQHEDTRPFAVSAELAGLVRLALEISRDSEGTFDVTVGPLVDAWGFGPPGRPVQPVGERQLDELRQRVGHDKLSVQGSSLTKAHPRLRIDLSAIAKGHAVDEVVRLLESADHRDFLVEIGGEVRARGRTAPGVPFRVGITDPRGSAMTAYGSIRLEAAALATSGNYRNHYELAGQRQVHTLDPTTGEPVRHSLLSASVLHPRCAVADAWATALMAAGPQRAWHLARSNGLAALLLVAAPGDGLEVRATPGFPALLTAKGRP